MKTTRSPHSDPPFALAVFDAACEIIARLVEAILAGARSFAVFFCAVAGVMFALRIAYNVLKIHFPEVTLK